jgi:hypothetical protein
MHCHAVWDRDITTQLLPKAFINGDFKQHREQMLFERGRAMLPALQQRAAAVRAIRVIEETTKDMNARMTELYKRVRVIRNDIYEDLRSTWFMEEREAVVIKNRVKAKKRDKNTLLNEIKDLRRDMHLNLRTINYIEQTGQIIEPGQEAPGWNPTPPPPPRFIRGCPAETCRGFMGDSGSLLKCGVCSLECCKKCHEPLEDDHACKPENVETAKLLVKDTRPCPKCSVPIFKVNGCDQMWCVFCQTTFSWNTGEIATGHIHNPHYYEWMRRQNREIPRTPGDIPGGDAAPCMGGNLIVLNTLFNWTLPINKKDEVRDLFNIHRNIVHITRVEIPRFRPHDDNQALYQEPLVSYLLNELGDDELKHKLQRKEKENQKKRAIFQVLEMVVAATRDIINTMHINHPQPTVETIHDLIGQLNVVKEFSNEALLRQGKIYDSVPMVFNEQWAFVSLTKYNKE